MEEDQQTVTEMSNVSETLLLPCLKIREDLRGKFYNHGYLGTYSLCESLTYHFYPVYILFRPRFGIEFFQFSQQLEKNQNYIETLDLPEGKVLFIFRIPARFENDFELIKAKRFTSLSPEFKSCFPTRKYSFDEHGRIEKDASGRPLMLSTPYVRLFEGKENDPLYTYNEKEETVRWKELPLTA